MTIPRTRYATTGDGLSIAYQQLGDTGPDLVWVTGTASHVELFWELPGWAQTMRRLSSFSRVVWFDKRGTGLSDRSIGSASLEARMDDIRAVMDATGTTSAVLVGVSESAAMAALFAATFPERVQRLVLLAGWAHDPDGERAEAFAELVEAHWGTGILLEAIWARGVADTDLLARIERAMGSPKSVAAVVRANARFDVRPALAFVQAPTLVIHCTRDPMVPVEGGRALARLIPGATLVEVSGEFHGSGRPDEMDLYGRAVEEFVIGSIGSGRGPDRVLSTVLFTDIVDSTARATEVGDRRWAELLDDHDRICSRAVQQRRGRIVKMTGDGLLATFDGPASAISAAHAMVANLGVLDLAIRAGVHTGEIERRADDIGGVGVHLAARIMTAAPPGEVWVSSTVPGLSAGSGIAFADRGQHVLKGIEGVQELHAACPPPASVHQPGVRG